MKLWLISWLLILINDPFNRDLKRQYSWLPKGSTNEVICTFATSNWSMITAIVSNGEFLWTIIEETGNTNKFWKFLLILNYAICYVKMKEASECIILLDNASIHSSNQTLKIINKIDMSCQFLLACSPSLAPVELFFRILKNKLRRTLHNEGIWFSKWLKELKYINLLRT